MTNQNKSFVEESEEKISMIIDSFCEPKVMKTKEHPNCEYVFTHIDIGDFEKSLKSFMSSRLRQLIEEVRKGVEAKKRRPAKGTATGSYTTYLIGGNSALDSVLELLDEMRK